MSAYRDRIAEFAGASAQVLGISTDDKDTSRRFAESLKLPFPLLSDEGGAVSRAYGVWDGKSASRATFVIDASGKITKVVEGLSAISPSQSLEGCRLPQRGI